MSISRIVNAAPMVRSLGIDDASTRPEPIEDIYYPQHLPVFYFQSDRGASQHVLSEINLLQRVYGKRTFDPLDIYYNHQTLGLATAVAEGNMCVTHRISNGTHAKLLLCLDVLTTNIPQYQRYSDGSYVLDNDLSPIPTGHTENGVLAKWVLIADGSNPTDQYIESGVPYMGQHTVKIGTQTDPNDGEVSKLYPIAEFFCDSAGLSGTSVGIRLFADHKAVDLDEFNSQKAFPYKIQLIQRSDNTYTPKIKRSIFGSATTDFTFNKQAVDGLSGKSSYLKYVIDDRYSNTTDGRYEYMHPLLSNTHVYEENLDLVCNLIRKSEDKYLIESQGGTYDQRAEWVSEDNRYMTNIISGIDEEGAPYHTFMIDETATPDSVRLTPYTNIYMRGGEDRLLENDDYEAMVRDDVYNYNDPDHEYQDLAVHVESAIWDTGFTVPTKISLIDFISQRHDTFVTLATHVNDDDDFRKGLTEEEELSTAIALRTRLRLFPESEYFATPVTRAMIIGGSGRIRNSQWRNRTTLAIDRLTRAARYMGASNGSWRNGFQFSHAPGSVIQTMFDVNIPWVPASRRVRNWDVGLNLPLAYNTRDFFYPAMKTVYDNDTSVLTSYITVMACCQLEKIGHAAWREYSGVDYMTNGELAVAIEGFVSRRAFGIFDERFVIIPHVFFTRNDIRRGYSWHLEIEIYAANMKTVETLNIKSFRLSDSPIDRSEYKELGGVVLI